MRIVVFSDSHNHGLPLNGIVDARQDADLFLHLGDGEREFEDLRFCYPEKRMLFVRGNCDWGPDAATEDIVTADGVNIFFTHGHMYNVKRGHKELARRAKALGAEIACFGHTHVALSTWSDGIYLLNPGSVCLPRSSGPSYGMIDLTGAGIAINIVRI